MVSPRKNTTTTKGEWWGRSPKVEREPAEAALRVLSGEGVCDICGGYNADNSPLFDVNGVSPSGALSTKRQAVRTWLCQECERSWVMWVNNITGDMNDLLISEPAMGWADWIERRREQIHERVGRP